MEWVLMTGKAARINGLTCFPNYGGSPYNKFLVTHPLTDLWESCLTCAIGMTAGPSSFLELHKMSNSKNVTSPKALTEKISLTKLYEEVIFTFRKAKDDWKNVF
jgi:hypothetical protein